MSAICSSQAVLSATPWQGIRTIVDFHPVWKGPRRRALSRRIAGSSRSSPCKFDDRTRAQFYHCAGWPAG